MDRRRRSEGKLTWRVDEAATTDESGLRRHVPADLARLSVAQRDAALAAMSRSLGAVPADVARSAAIERLTELRAAGKMSEAQYLKVRRRLESY